MIEQGNGLGLTRSPLYDRQLQAGAKFGPFAGWSMPLEYAGGGVVAEHTAVRSAVGLFDVSHLGTVLVRGPGAAALVNRVLTNDLAKIGDGRAQYSLLCTPDGGVVDDLIVYLRGPEDLLLIPNAANAAAVVTALRSRAPDQVQVLDRHTDFAVLAVQGPRAPETLTAVGLGVRLDYMSFTDARLSGVPLTVCRTGYTGELGYELVLPSSGAVQVWDAVVAAGKPYGLRLAGLGARDTLRTEMGYPLHGQDLSPQITPLEARLGWAVGWQKSGFLGAAALRAEKEAGPRRLLQGLRAAGRGIPRPGMDVRDPSGRTVGVVTSGTFSPTLRTGIALALLDERYADGTELQIDVRGRVEPFTVTTPPFVAAAVR